MKKLIPLFPAFVLALLLTACGAPGADSPAPTANFVETVGDADLSSTTQPPVAGEAETPEAGASVYTDWSKLEPYERQIRRHHLPICRGRSF